MPPHGPCCQRTRRQARPFAHFSDLAGGDHFLPIVQAGVDLLEADERDFEDRCRRILDADGTAMIDELYAEMEIVGRQMRLLVDGLDVTGQGCGQR